MQIIQETFDCLLTNRFLSDIKWKNIMPGLFDKLCSTDCLFAAWSSVKSKNSAGGIDGLSVLDFDNKLSENLFSLQKEL